ncbi:class I SAM-dependent methyltransferase [Tenggerimyces flavus]|uniref:Class I SAM-dependent methyltransferase n=1 Tax=Tenggerimyces flavus TaxID=1708749 RepID=A0ABV7Y5P4_9ACTN|nr:class I SAM-dependent methyltransferase [Tenggerimyces flavus]MBM7788520.1 SAM-dependent methyltransferase [Tenggerimyces flavus]
MDAHTATNQRLWDELAPLHAASEFYDVDAFLRGKDTLADVEVAEVGDVRGKRLLHLMCHFGQDTLSWARRGAQVTGLDFSAEALAIARDLAKRAGIEATFQQGDVMRAADELDDTFDIVFLSRGVLVWLEDLTALASICARLLRPGGTFYLYELHPLVTAGDSGYFHASDPAVVVKDGSYAVTDPGMTHQESHEWQHSLGDVVSALIDAGIQLEFLHEFPGDDGRSPSMFSVRGHSLRS